MSKEQLIDFSKSATRYILTLVFAAVGTYVGIELNMRDMQNDIVTNKTNIVAVDKANKINGQSIFELQINQSGIIQQGKYDVPYLKYTRSGSGPLFGSFLSYSLMEK